MFKEYAINYITILQDIYNSQKGKMNFTIKGDMGTLLLISRNDLTSPKDISKHMNISTARVATILNSLESKEYIVRRINEDDRRKILISITKLGLEKANQIKSTHLNITKHIFEQLGEEDSKKALEIMRKLQVILNDINNIKTDWKVD